MLAVSLFAFAQVAVGQSQQQINLVNVYAAYTTLEINLEMIAAKYPQLSERANNAKIGIQQSFAKTLAYIDNNLSSSLPDGQKKWPELKRAKRRQLIQMCAELMDTQSVPEVIRTGESAVEGEFFPTLRMAIDTLPTFAHPNKCGCSNCNGQDKKDDFIVESNIPANINDPTIADIPKTFEDGSMRDILIKTGARDSHGMLTDQAMAARAYAPDAESSGYVSPKYHGILHAMGDSLLMSTARTSAGFTRAVGLDEATTALDDWIRQNPDKNMPEHSGLAGWLTYQGVKGVVTAAPIGAVGLLIFLLIRDRLSGGTNRQKTGPKKKSNYSSDIKFKCVFCKQSLEAPSDMKDLLIECPSCNKQINICASKSDSVSSRPHYNRRQRMKYVLAFLACAGLWILYAVLGAAVFGWEHGGGAIPMLMLLAAMGATWRAITKKSDKTQSGDK